MLFKIQAKIIAVFNNMRTLKFKPQLTVYVFRCRQSSKRISRSCLLVVIGRFWSIFFVSVFQGSLAVAIIMIDGSEKPNRQLGFELQSSHAVYDICRLQTADCRLQTADRRLQTADRILTRKILLTVTSSSTAFPAQNNINLDAKILLDFSWWFTVMALDSM